MNKSYNDVEITDADISALYETEATTPQSESTDSNTVEETELVEEAKPVEETETQQTEATSTEATNPAVADSFVIDGESYNADTIKEWMSDHQNKTDWSKSNTEKAQELSKWRKLADEIDSNADFKTHISDFFFDKPEMADKLGLNGEVNPQILGGEEVQSEPETDSNSIQSRLEQLESFESERIVEQRVGNLDRQLTNLEQKFPDYLGETKSDGFLDFAEANAERFTIRGMPNLELAFREWSYDAMAEEISHLKKLDNNRLRNNGKIIDSSKKGAKETKTPKKYQSYKDVQLSDPEIAKYFNS